MTKHAASCVQVRSQPPAAPLVRLHTFPAATPSVQKTARSFLVCIDQGEAAERTTTELAKHAAKKTVACASPSCSAIQQGTRYLKCSRCLVAHYCGSGCQHAHWANGHKGCKKVTVAAAVSAAAREAAQDESARKHFVVAKVMNVLSAHMPTVRYSLLTSERLPAALVLAVHARTGRAADGYGGGDARCGVHPRREWRVFGDGPGELLY